MAINDLRKDADALEAIIVAAHEPDTDIDGVELGEGRLREEHLLRSTLRQRVGIEAAAAADAVDDAGGVGKTGHVGYGLVVYPTFWGRHGWVIRDDEMTPIGGVGGYTAVTQPEEIPVIAIRGMRVSRILVL